MTSAPKLKVVMFTGGRGTRSITNALLQHRLIELTLLVNAYDDGLSTGALRAFVPGMLGPSDIRKNTIYLMPEANASDRALRTLIEYRFPEAITPSLARQTLEALASHLLNQSFPIPEMAPQINELNLGQIKILSGWTKTFLRFLDESEKAGRSFHFGDCSIGNLLFVGAYLSCKRSFNDAIREFGNFAQITGKIFNITDGENYVLMALKENGALLSTEAEIVSEQDTLPLEEIFLLPDYPIKNQYRGLAKPELKKYLQQASKTPILNSDAKKALETADIIIYGPGTQHSSLFPSYLTGGTAEAIAANTGAEKIFIGNIRKDFEIRGETTTSLVQKFFFYLNRKGSLHLSWNELVTLFFIQDPSQADQTNAEFVAFEKDQFPYPPSNVILTNWSADASSHLGGRVLDELIRVINTKLQIKLKPFHHMVSIIVPGLNEARTVKKVLHELTVLPFSAIGLGMEVIFVDGGSTDQTLELAKSVPDVRVYQLKGTWGRGAAIRLGIEKANGNIVVFFPSDDEYNASDLVPIIQAISKNEFQAVFGSRMIKCINLNQQIRDIYRGNTLLYLTSKYGGMLTGILGFLLFNRFVSDPLTSIKAFDMSVLKSLELSSTGFEIETEILAKLGKKGHFILEVPVDYRPRTKLQGKKTTITDGLRALWKLIWA